MAIKIADQDGFAVKVDLDDWTFEILCDGQKLAEVDTRRGIKFPPGVSWSRISYSKTKVRAMEFAIAIAYDLEEWIEKAKAAAGEMSAEQKAFLAECIERSKWWREEAK